jgi:oxalate decarboxylase
MSGSQVKSAFIVIDFTSHRASQRNPAMIEGLEEPVVHSSLQPVRGNEGAPILGPTNPAREAQSLARLTPPVTDHGTLPNLKWTFADSHNKLEEGGWARQTTVREIPIATELACVNMRLEAGVIREMHWHKPAEWGFVIKGNARVTTVDEEGRTYQADCAEGDLWNFPGGIPHSIQGLAGEGCEFLLVFDDGAFNEDETFLVTDFLAHIPKSILAKNFNVSASAFANIPKSELYIFRANIPGALAQDRVVGAGPTPVTYTHRMAAQEPIRTGSGTVRITDSTNFPAAATIAAGLVEVEPGGMRELHWHRTSDELQYYLEGQGRMTVYASNTNAGTFDYQAGDVGYVPKVMPHYIENTGTTTLRYLEVWKTDKFSDMSLAQWLAFTPYELVRAHLQIDRSVLDRVSTTKTPIVGRG